MLTEQCLGFVQTATKYGEYLHRNGVRLNEIDHTLLFNDDLKGRLPLTSFLVYALKWNMYPDLGNGHREGLESLY